MLAFADVEREILSLGLQEQVLLGTCHCVHGFIRFVVFLRYALLVIVCYCCLFVCHCAHACVNVLRMHVPGCDALCACMNAMHACHACTHAHMYARTHV